MGIAVLSALCLAACATGSGGSVPAARQGPYSDLTGQTLEVAAAWSGTEQDRFSQVLRLFEQRTGATTTFTSTGDELSTVVGTRLKGGRPPDVVILPNPSLLGQYAAQGALVPASEPVQAAVDRYFAPVWKALGSVDGTLYGVWFKVAYKSTVWYRTAAFDQAGVQEPKTWDEFLRGAQTLADAGTTPLSIAGADGWTLTDWFENVYLRTAGARKYDQLTRHEIRWTDESVRTALSTLARLWARKDLLVPNALQTDFPTSVTQVFADSPKGAIVFEADFVAGVINSQTTSKAGEDAKYFDFPSVGGSAGAGLFGGDVAVALTDTNGAQELLRFLASPEAAEVWARQGGYVSANKALAASAYPDDTTRRVARTVAGAGDGWRFDMSDQTPAAFGNTPGGGEWKILQDFLDNPADVDGTAGRLEAAAAAAYR